MSLTLDEIRKLAADMKENLQREANQGIREKDFEQGIGALASMEAIDTFVYNMEVAAGAPYRDVENWRGKSHKLKRGKVLKIVRAVRK